MKLFFLPAKSFISALCTIIICNINAQDNPVNYYLHTVGDYADIYNGRLETIYNAALYENFPYYTNADFTSASIVYRNKLYPDQKVRLDLYKEQLIVLVPGKQFGIILGSPKVEKVYMYNKSFVWLAPSKGDIIKEGYYIQLLEKEKIQLFCKDNYEILYKQRTYRFDRKIRHFLFYNNRYYQVKNKNSFSKLFPQYKKQINNFSRINKLDFTQDKDRSLIALSDYCEELINSTNY